MKVHVYPDNPRMQLSADCPVTPDFRDEINAWMVQFFGVSNLVPDGDAIVMQEAGLVYMNPRTFDQFKNIKGKTND